MYGQHLAFLVWSRSASTHSNINQDASLREELKLEFRSKIVSSKINRTNSKPTLWESSIQTASLTNPSRGWTLRQYEDGSSTLTIIKKKEKRCPAFNAKRPQKANWRYFRFQTQKTLRYKDCNPFTQSKYVLNDPLKIISWKKRRRNKWSALKHARYKKEAHLKLCISYVNHHITLFVACLSSLPHFFISSRKFPVPLFGV